MTKRRKFSYQIKAKIALEALRGDRTTQEIAAKHRLHPTQFSTWKRQAVEGLSGVFSEGVKPQGPSDSEIKDLHAKIGRLAVVRLRPICRGLGIMRVAIVFAG
jgi:transposase